MADDNSCRNSCMGLLFIVGIALFAASFDTVEPTQMGILRDDISKSIDPTKVYFGGRYFVGLGKGFVRYPTTLQFLAADNVEAATKDKLSVSIEVALQYKLDPKKIHVLYSERQTSYQSFLERTLVETIKEVVSVQSVLISTPLTNALLTFAAGRVILSTKKRARSDFFFCFVYMYDSMCVCFNRVAVRELSNKARFLRKARGDCGRHGDGSCECLFR